MRITISVSVVTLPCVMLLALLLAACGGGGGGGAPSLTQQTDDEPQRVLLTADQDYNTHETLADVETVSLNEDVYTRQVSRGIENIGANTLHWTPAPGSNPNPAQNENAENAENAATRYIRGGGVTVGIVDGGVDLEHPELKDNITMGAGITVGGTAYSDPTPYVDENGKHHGTGVAGIIGAILNTAGVVGVAPEAKLLPVNVLDVGDADNPVPHVNFAEAYAYIAANNAFVVNNSWEVLPQLLYLQDKGRNVCVTMDECWLKVPFAYGVKPLDKTLIDQKDTTIKHVFSYYQALVNAVTNDDLLLVFGNGNSGWNSERGTVYICLQPDPKGCSSDSMPPLSSISAASLTVSKVYVEGAFTVILAAPTIISFPDRNSIGALNQAPVDFDSVFADNWLNVVAVDTDNKIARLSDGCGAAKANCLAAPGMNIRTTYIYDSLFPDDLETIGSGSSFAAPHVSGAAALLKGAFPNLRARDVLEILLQSADGLGSCAPEEGQKEDKTVSCTDKVYGHGILNIVDAFIPDSFIRMASPAQLNAGGVDEKTFSLANSRIELSPAFGAAAWQKESLAIGGLDSYGRVYYTQIDLSDGVFVVKPLWEDGDISGGGIHASYASPLLRAQQSAAFMAQESLAGGQWQGRQDNMDYSLSYGARNQQRAIGWQQGGGRLSWNYLSGSDDVAVSDFNTDESSWRLPFSAAAMHQFAGAVDFSDSAAGLPQVGISYGRSKDDGISQLASYAQWGDEDSGSLWLEGGYIQEKDGVLGASFAGGFALSTGETFYQRLSGRRQLFGVEWVADYVHARSFAAGDGGIVQSLKARSDAWTVGANRGHWSLQWSQPLAINAGSMALSYISGYTESGDYAVTDKRLDISSGNRLQRTTLLYMREATDDLTFAFSLDYLRNAPHRNYRKDAVIGAAALRYTF